VAVLRLLRLRLRGALRLLRLRLLRAFALHQRQRAAQQLQFRQQRCALLLP